MIDVLRPSVIFGFAIVASVGAMIAVSWLAVTLSDRFGS